MLRFKKQKKVDKGRTQRLQSHGPTLVQEEHLINNTSDRGQPTEQIGIKDRLVIKSDVAIKFKNKTSGVVIETKFMTFMSPHCVTVLTTVSLKHQHDIHELRSRLAVQK